MHEQCTDLRTTAVHRSQNYSAQTSELQQCRHQNYKSAQISELQRCTDLRTTRVHRSQNYNSAQISDSAQTSELQQPLLQAGKQAGSCAAWKMRHHFRVISMCRKNQKSLKYVRNYSCIYKHISCECMCRSNQ